jgi:hypothetical protein
MKQQKFDEKKAKEELEIRKEALLEAEKRRLYLEGLKKDQKFKKYILEEIIEVEIEANKNISSSLSTLVGQPADAVKDIILAKSAALKASENIRNKIVN